MVLIMNFIFGAGGFAREVAWLLHDIGRASGEMHNFEAFVASDDAPNLGSHINGVVVMSESEFFGRHQKDQVSVFIAVGSPKLKAKLHQRCLEVLAAPSFPAAVHPSVLKDDRFGAVLIGRGSIICAGSVLTTDIRVGDFVHINLNSTLGHDCVVGDYSTLSPGVHISGGVELGHSCFIGTGAVVLENLVVVAGTSIGAGATVVRSIAEAGTYVGTPAKQVIR